MAEKLYNAYNQKIELTKEQADCINYEGDRALLVKGYAGAGKSLVLMAIAQKFMKKYAPGAENKIAIFTFQNTLASTIKSMLKANGDVRETVSVITINHYIASIYNELVNYKRAPWLKFPSESEVNNLYHVKKTIEIHKSKYGKHRFHDVKPEFWLDEFKWMKRLNVWTDNEEYYLQLPRKGRGSSVRMSQSDRKVAYQLFLCYCDFLKSKKHGDWEDQTLFLLRHPELIDAKYKYEQVLIDEAQDLSLAEMMLIKCFCKKNLFIAMDMNQRIHDRIWTPKLLGIASTTKKLTTSMRTTVQIEALAESVRSKNDINLAEDDKSIRAIPEREGSMPVITHLTSAAEEQKYVIRVIQAYMNKNPKCTIGLIAAKKVQIKYFDDWLTSAGIYHEVISKDMDFSMGKPGVKVVTGFGAKGLEFDLVIIPMFAEGYYPFNRHFDDDESMAQFIIKMRNLVYVSMTRAKHALLITFWGTKGSRFLADMDPQLYDWRGEEFHPTPYREVRIEGLDEYDRFAGTMTGANGKTGSSVKSSSSVKLKKDISNPVEMKKKEKVSQTSYVDLFEFLRKKGVECVDQRDKGGFLWVIGGYSLKPILDEAKDKYGALWTFNSKGGSATCYKVGWSTKCSR